MAYRILAIDDDPDILELYGLLLEEEGYEAHLSFVAFEDITEVERLHPDLIILDARIRQANDGLLATCSHHSYPSHPLYRSAQRQR